MIIATIVVMMVTTLLLLIILINNNIYNYDNVIKNQVIWSKKCFLKITSAM